MWLAQTVALVSVFVILFCSTEGKPNVDLPVDDNEFLCLLGDKGSGITKSQLTTCPCPDLGGGCRCVPFHSCLDPQPEKIPDNYGCFSIDERTILGIGERNKSPCPNLELCCKCTKGGSSSPPKPISVKPTEPPKCTKGGSPSKPDVPSTERPPPPTPPPQRQCGKRNPKGVDVTIMGFTDKQSQVGEFPWMVAVLSKDTTYVAGGSLVHPRVILTATHKIQGKNAGDLVVRIGDWDLKDRRVNPEPQNIGVDRIVSHPHFVRHPFHENNVALLILKKTAVYNKLVMPICLPQPNQVFDGSSCFVTGWGKDEFGAQGEFQSIMKKANIPILSDRNCQSALRGCCSDRLGSEFNLHDSMTCAGGLGEDACTGDGGSPLVCPNPKNHDEYIQVGIVSWGIGCNIFGNPGVYASIPKAVDWITQTIQKETGIDERSIVYDERIG